MFVVVMILHVVACVVLIAVILLQSGRGGGLSEMLGGAQSQTKLFGTQTSTFLSKATSYCAILFLVTSVSLGFLTSRRSRSLMEGAEIKPFFDAESLPAGASEQDVQDMVAKLTAEAKKAAAVGEAAGTAATAEADAVVGEVGAVAAKTAAVVTQAAAEVKATAETTVEMAADVAKPTEE